MNAGVGAWDAPGDGGLDAPECRERSGQCRRRPGWWRSGRCSRECRGTGGRWRRSGTSSTRAWVIRWGITGTLAHRSFPAPRWAEVMFTLAGTLGCVGSPVGWAQMHRRHHLYSDVEGDPVHRASSPVSDAASVVDGRIRHRTGKRPGVEADVPCRPAAGIRDALVLRASWRCSREPCSSSTGGGSCTGGRCRWRGRCGWRGSMPGRRIATGTAITTHRTGAVTCGGARSSPGARDGTTIIMPTRGRGATGSGGGSGTSGRRWCGPSCGCPAEVPAAASYPARPRDGQVGTEMRNRCVTTNARTSRRARAYDARRLQQIQGIPHDVQAEQLRTGWPSPFGLYRAGISSHDEHASS